MVRASLSLRSVLILTETVVMMILILIGKDRTSMGVTLEEGRLLAEDCGVLECPAAIQNFRKHGVRRMNVYANTGQSMYAFNSIQRRALPACLRPPPGTFTGKVNS